MARDGVEHDVAKSLDGIQTAIEADIEQALARGNLTGRQFDIVAPDGSFDVADRKVARCQCAAVDPDADGEATFAADVDAGHAVERRQSVGNGAFDKVGNLFRRMPVGRDGKPHHRVGVAIALDDARFVDAVGQVRANPANGVAHIVRRLVDVAAGLKFDDRAAAATPTLRTDRLDASHASDRALNNFGDVGVDDLRRRAGIDCRYRDDRGINVGQFAHRDRQQ